MSAAATPGLARRARRWLVTVLKLGLTVGLLAWLVSKGHLEPERLERALRKKELIALALALGAFNISTSAARWLLLLRSEGIACSLGAALRLTWIGHFWNMVIPGAVSGDAVKMYYIGRLAPGKREEAWTTVFVDRLIGMAALVSLSTIATVANLDFMLGRPELRNTALTMLAVLLALSGTGLVLSLGVGRRTVVFESFRARLPFTDGLRRAYHAMLRLGRRPGTVVLALLISLFSHASAVVLAFILGHAADERSLDFVQYCVVVPVALFSNAVPLTPGGIGVGETVLGNLFAWSNGDFAAGTTIMLLYRLTLYALALIGAALYVAHRSEVVVPAGFEPGRSGDATTSTPCSP
ncbi:MAG: flippase-like domain-containing protein [Planctomycetes bacterium]|nr:flippase-like domain-containing protein [Planctomycetota bacterium]